MFESVPLKLMTQLPEVWSRTGAPALHPSFERWLDARKRRAARTWTDRHWWTPAWAEGELYAHFPAEAVTAVLAVRRDGQTWEQATALTSITLSEAVTLERQMAAMCRSLATTVYL